MTEDELRAMLDAAIEAASVTGYCEQALAGTPSDFALSFSLPRRIYEMRVECDRLRLENNRLWAEKGELPKKG